MTETPRKLNRGFAAEVAKRVVVEGEPQKKVAKDLKTSVATISRALKLAREEKIIQCEIDEDVLSWVSDEDLGLKLCRMFKLSRAIVMREARDPEFDFNPKGAKDSDQLHRVLGKAVASYLQTNVRPHDHIATVGGRGAFFVGHFAARGHNNSIPGVHVSAISGRMATQLHGSGGRYLFPSVDADDAAYMLARAFCDDFVHHYHPLHKKVAYDEPMDESAREKEFSHLFTEGRPSSSTIAICGVGTLDANHMFLRKHSDESQDAWLAPIRTQINELLDLFQLAQNEKGIYPPVGDVANRLFLTEEMEDNALRERVNQKLSDINQRIVGLTFSQLSQIQMIILSAGGLNKYQAIRRVLSFQKATGEPFVSVLCTDAQVAEKLLCEQENPPQPINVKNLPGE